MPSTYSPDLRIELIANGEQAGTWGVTTNNNLGTLIEDAISGLASVIVTNVNQALTAANGVSDQARCAVISLTATTGANFAVYVPPVTKLYVIVNNSSYDATIYCSTVIGNTTAAGSGVIIPAGKAVLIRSDGTDISEQFNHIGGNLGVGGALAVTGTSTLTGNTSVGGTLSVTGTGAFTGAVSGPTASAGTNTTQLATTAFVATALGALGTMATQNANSVAITGGTITGLSSPLPLASGGTGQTSAGTNGQVLTTDGTSASWQTAPQPIGVGQTWQSFNSTQRASGTWYQNTTGRPIQVNVGGYGANGATMTSYVNTVASNTGRIQVGGGALANCCGVEVGHYQSWSFIVPNLYYYQSNYGSSIWFNSELR
jgi:hypothetical protein